MHGKVSGLATDSSIDLLYQLGMTQDSGSFSRVQALCAWLGDSARLAVQKHHGGTGGASFFVGGMRDEDIPSLPSPAPAHVHCVAVVLWHSLGMSINYNLKNVVSREFLR